MNCMGFFDGVSVSRGKGRIGWADGKGCSQRLVAQHGVPKIFRAINEVNISCLKAFLFLGEDQSFHLDLVAMCK